jgi:hypothetical protein
MKRFIANYTIIPGKELINSITVIGDDNRLKGIEPLSGELASTRYVTNPMCVVDADSAAAVGPLFNAVSSKEAFKRLFFEKIGKQDLKDKVVSVFELDFVDKMVIKLV